MITLPPPEQSDPPFPQVARDDHLKCLTHIRSQGVNRHGGGTAKSKRMTLTGHATRRRALY
jgi:hypothetical protein